jgi:hypothetical protein
MRDRRSVQARQAVVRDERPEVLRGAPSEEVVVFPLAGVAFETARRDQREREQASVGRDLVDERVEDDRARAITLGDILTIETDVQTSLRGRLIVVGIGNPEKEPEFAMVRIKRDVQDTAKVSL